MRAGTRVNARQAPKMTMREPTHLVFGEGRRWIGGQAIWALIHTRRGIGVGMLGR